MDDSLVLMEVYNIIKDRKLNPKEGSYTNYLYDSGIDKILKKVGEEATETIIAAKNDNKDEIISEVCDLLYHISVLLSVKDISWDMVFSTLRERELKESNLKVFNTKADI